MALNTGDLAQFLVLASIAGFQPGGGGGGGVTYPIALNKGGTNAVLAPSLNSIVIGTATAMGFLATANNGILVTSASGVPSISNVLPSGITISGYLPTPTSLGLNRLVVGNSNTTMIGLVTPNSSILGSSATGVPTWYTTLPAGLTVPGYSRTTTYAGNPNGNVPGTVGDFVIDTTDGNELWYCATSGTATTATWTLSAGAGGSGVTSITAGTGLSGGTITTTGTIALAAMPAATILANATAGTAVPTAVTIGSRLSFTAGVLNAVDQLATPVPLTSGGTGNAITSAAPGSIYTISSSGTGTILLGPTHAGWALLSGEAGVPGQTQPTWTTYALPATVTANGLLYATSTTALGQVAAVNSAVLQTNATGVPSLQTTLPNGFVTYAAIQNVTSAKLLGNPTGAAAAPSEITIGSGLTLTGSTLSATGAGVTFPITLAHGGTNTDLSNSGANALMYTNGSAGVSTLTFGTIGGSFLQIAAGASALQYSSYSLPTAIAPSNVYGLMYATSTTSVVFSAGGVANGFVVTDVLGRPSIVAALPANSVGLSSLAQIPATTLLGNSTNATANVSTISIAGALTLTGGVLTNTSPSATGTGASGTWPISITGNAATANSATTATVASSVAANSISTSSIANSAVTYAKIQNMAASTLLGNPTTSAAAPSEITIGSGLSLSTTGVLTASGAGVAFPITLAQGGTNADLSAATNGSLVYVATGSNSLVALTPVASAVLTTNSAGIPQLSTGISLAQLPVIPSGRLLGNPPGAAAVPVSIQIGTGLTFSTASGGTINNNLVDSNGNLIISAGIAQNGVSIQSPVTGFSITLVAANYFTLLTPAGTLASGTIIFPTPTLNQRLRVSTTQAITALTVTTTGAATIVGAPTSLAANDSFEMYYNLTAAKWYPFETTPAAPTIAAAIPPTSSAIAANTTFSTANNNVNRIIYLTAAGLTLTVGTIAVGSYLEIYSNGFTFTLAQVAGVNILVPGGTTTTGITGSMVSLDSTTWLKLFSTSATTLQGVPNGNFTVN